MLTFPGVNAGLRLYALVYVGSGIGALRPAPLALAFSPGVVGATFILLAEAISGLFGNRGNHEVIPGQASESPESCEVRANHLTLRSVRRLDCQKSIGKENASLHQNHTLEPKTDEIVCSSFARVHGLEMYPSAPSRITRFSV